MDGGPKLVAHGADEVALGAARGFGSSRELPLSRVRFDEPLVASPELLVRGLERSASSPEHLEHLVQRLRQSLQLEVSIRARLQWLPFVERLFDATAKRDDLATELPRGPMAEGHDERSQCEASRREMGELRPSIPLGGRKARPILTLDVVEVDTRSEDPIPPGHFAHDGELAAEPARGRHGPGVRHHATLRISRRLPDRELRRGPKPRGHARRWTVARALEAPTREIAILRQDEQVPVAVVVGDPLELSSGVTLEPFAGHQLVPAETFEQGHGLIDAGPQLAVSARQGSPFRRFHLLRSSVELGEEPERRHRGGDEHGGKQDHEG